MLENSKSYFIIFKVHNSVSSETYLTSINFWIIIVLYLVAGRLQSLIHDGTFVKKFARKVIFMAISAIYSHLLPFTSLCVTEDSSKHANLTREMRPEVLGCVLK